jgi:hypothetical protein
MAARFFQQLGVLRNLAAAERAQAGHDVAADAAAAHHHAEDLALGLPHAVAGDVFTGDDDHGVSVWFLPR